MSTSKPRSRAKAPTLSKSQTVTVRLDPRLRHSLELASRKHRRTLSSYIEWAIERSFSDVYLSEPGETIADEERNLWSVDEAERFLKLATKYPDLLDFDEQEIWKMLLDSSILEPAINYWNNSGEPQWDRAALLRDIAPLLRDLWEDLLEAHAAGWNAQREWVAKTKEELQKKAASGNEAPQQEEDAPWDPNDPSLEDIPF